MMYYMNQEQIPIIYLALNAVKLGGQKRLFQKNAPIATLIEE